MIDEIKKISQTSKRLPWDEYFMSIAFLASLRSNCERLQVGSVIVRENRIISMGYNGFLSGSPHTSRVRDGHEQSIVHSEINAIADCAKRGVSINNAKIYITHYPCINCFRSIAASGIKTIIYYDDYKNDPLIHEIAHEAEIRILKLNHS